MQVSRRCTAPDAGVTTTTEVRMSEHNAVIRWERGTDAFAGYKYSRGHAWYFDEGVVVPASASPTSIRAPWAVEAAVDPEEALVAALSSCHMLWFLAGAAKAGYIVDRYEDPASGTMEPDAAGKVAVTRVTLRPRVAFSGKVPSAEEHAALHHAAHELCNIANSVKSEVLCEPEIVPA
jgi:organic hydroperoxide reductase OsmC/OhrA